jgi:hypothetical protein
MKHLLFLLVFTALSMAQIIPNPPQYDYFLTLSKGRLTYSALENLQGQQTLDSSGSFALVWGETHAYSYLDTAQVLVISSTDSTDTMEVTIDYLDADYVRKSETIEVKGFDREVTTGDVWRVLSLATFSEPSGKIMAWQSIAYTGGVPDDSTAIKEVINIGKLKSEKCRFTTPKLTGAYIWQSDLTSTADWQLWTSEGVEKRIYSKDYKIPYRIPPKTDFEIQAKVGAETLLNCEMDIELSTW